MTTAVKYTDIELRHEINTLLDALAARHESWRPQWIAQTICHGHLSALAAEADEMDRAFWEYAGYTVTRKLTTRCINERLDDEPSPAPQLDLPGFERVHLQAYYVVTRDGEDIAVPVLELTDEEILAKAALFRSQSQKLTEHARELERFLEWRRHA